MRLFSIFSIPNPCAVRSNRTRGPNKYRGLAIYGYPLFFFCDQIVTGSLKNSIFKSALSGRTKQKFPYKAKAPEHDTIVKRGFRVDHEKILCSYVHEACF